MTPKVVRNCLHTITKFHLFRYIAHEIEEDDEELKMEIYPWALGSELWKSKVKEFLYKRNVFLQRMKFRAVVSRTTCDEVRFIFHFGFKRIHPNEIAETINKKMFK